VHSKFVCTPSLERTVVFRDCLSSNVYNVDAVANTEPIVSKPVKAGKLQHCMTKPSLEPTTVTSVTTR